MGVSALIASSATAFNLMRYFGAAYLLFLGISGLKDPPFKVGETSGNRRTLGASSYLRGFVVEATNPKTVTFFLALVPQVLATFEGSSTIDLVALCLIVPMTAIPIDMTVGLTGGTVARGIAKRPAVGAGLNYVASAVLIGLGFLVLVK